jgi:hypothetical protein
MCTTGRVEGLDLRAEYVVWPFHTDKLRLFTGARVRAEVVHVVHARCQPRFLSVCMAA